MKHFAVIALLLTSTIPLQADPQPVRAFLFTAPVGEFTDEASKARQDAMKDLREALTGKKRIVLVESREQAQIVLEVLGRTRETTGDYRKHDYNDRYTQSVKAHTVRVKLTAGTYETELVGDTVTSIKRKAAGEAADRIDDWLKANATKFQ